MGRGRRQGSPARGEIVSRFLYLYAGMLVLAAFLAAVSGCPSLFALPSEPARLYGSIAAGFLLAFCTVEGGKLLEGQAWYRNMADLFKRILTSPEVLGGELTNGRCFTIAFYSSVGEEALFRGFLQPWLIGLVGGSDPSLLPVVAGVVATSLIFGLIHFPVVPELRPWTAFAILMGLALGALAAWSGSLLGSCIAHLVVNWLNLKRLGAIDWNPSTHP